MSRPTTLSARAAQRLASGPLDPVTLMCDVCKVDRLHADAAERMAVALLSSHPEFVRLPSGHWALASTTASPGGVSAYTVRDVDCAGSTPSGSLLDVDFAVVDVETTGTSPTAGDKITEIAIARVRGGEVVDVFAQLVNPQRPIPPYITQLTRISWEMVRDQPTFREIAPAVVDRLAGHVFTAHNAAFDWRFVGEELDRGIGHLLAGPKLCTVRLARVLLPALPRKSLDHVTRYFGIEIEARHRAEGDAVATAQALVRMLRIAEDEGVRSWPALEKMLSTPTAKRRSTASDRRRRAFPLPASEDHIA
ncbi:exonuclease domain-containing protein [Gemmatimonas sp.]|uniref:3'-5' exonuclease n=1 Tax=Gemmatimonas sp. TaxID=1962908 RepID=UPI00286AB67B|nr:exonuclease domain-containing protein [Gemmatimonas sp.]